MTTATLTNSLSSAQIEMFDFILEHFRNESEPLFPRRVSSIATDNNQRLAFDREHALSFYQEAHGIDFRINAYPNYDYLITKGRLPWGYVPKNCFLFIDLDERKELQNTLNNIKMLFIGNAQPTVSDTGRGYHIYLPMLITQNEFNSNADLTIKLLRFIAGKVTNWKKDKANNPSFGSTLVRVPLTFNLKCIKQGIEPSEVRLIQRWNGIRACPDKELINQFMYMEKRHEILELKKQRVENEKLKAIRSGVKEAASQKEDALTEFLIFESKGIADGRKNVLYYVVARYLIRNKGMNKSAAKAVCLDWIRRCDSVSRLKESMRYYDFHIEHCLNDAISKKDKEAFSVEYLKALNYDVYSKFLDEYADKCGLKIEKSREVKIEN